MNTFRMWLTIFRPKSHPFLSLQIQGPPFSTT